MQISKEALKIAQAGIRYGLQLFGLYYSAFRVLPAGINRKALRFLLSPRVHIEQLSDPEKSRKPIFARRKSTDLRTLAQIFINDQYSLERLRRRDELKQLYKNISTSSIPLIVDAGANCGFASRYFRGIFPKSFVVAIEPDAENFLALRANVEGDDFVSCLHAGVASTTGKLDIVDEKAKKNAIQTKVSEDSGLSGIPCIPMNQILLDYGPESGYRPFIAKIDIEGFESELFTKNIEWVDKFPIIFIELHDWMLPNSAASQSFLKAISSNQRDFILIGDTIISIRNSQN